MLESRLGRLRNQGAKLTQARDDVFRDVSRNSIIEAGITYLRDYE
jgi:hypothetical protein